MQFLHAHQADIIAIILLLIAGLSIGNYACSVVYRLPRGQTPFEKHPFCGSCGTMLQPVDLFPVLSFLATRGRCRYCGAGIPAIYTAIEIVCAAVLIGYYFMFGLTPGFFAFATAAVFVVMGASIAYMHGFIASYLYSLACLLMLLGQASEFSGNFMPFLQRYVVVMVLAALATAVFWRIKHQAFDASKAQALWWFSMLALMVPFAFWQVYLAVTLIWLILRLALSARLATHIFLPCAVVISAGCSSLLVH